MSQGQLSSTRDRGDLSPLLPGATADAFVADAWKQWSSIPTVAISTLHAGQLAEDISGAALNGSRAAAAAIREAQKVSGKKR